MFVSEKQIIIFIFFLKLSKLQEIFRISFGLTKKSLFSNTKIFWINWSYIGKRLENICACLSRHDPNFGATLSGSTYLIPTSLYSNSFARNLLMYKSGCIFVHFTLHSPRLNFHLTKCCLHDTIQSQLFHFISVDIIFCRCKNAVCETSIQILAFCNLFANWQLQMQKLFTNQKGPTL